MKVSSVKYKKPSSAKWGQSRYPFNDMDVGQSFDVEESKRYSIATLAKRYGDRQSPKQKFSVKLFDVNGESKLKCVRVK